MKIMLFSLTLFIFACEDETVVAQEVEIDIPEFDDTLIIGATTGKKITTAINNCINKSTNGITLISLMSCIRPTPEFRLLRDDR